LNPVLKVAGVIAGPAQGGPGFSRDPSGEYIAMPAVDPPHIARAVAVLREPVRASGQSFDDHQVHAFEVIYRSYSAMLLSTTRRMLAADGDAEDVLHNVFTRLPRILGQYRGGGLGGWLRRVAQREALMQMRRSRCRREDRLSDHTCITAPDAHEWAVDSDQRLKQALSRLGKPLRDVVMLRVYHDYTHQQIAQALGITPAASEVRFCRAMKRMRVELVGASTPSLRRTA